MLHSCSTAICSEIFALAAKHYTVPGSIAGEHSGESGK
jgi:hypothetical protein